MKVDGWRCAFFPGLNGKPGLWTRGGLPFNGAGHILTRLVDVERALGGRYMIDGEFQVGGTLAATKAHQERGWKVGGEAGTFHAFDCVPLDDWRRGRCDIPLYDRKAMLARAIEATSCHPWEWREGSRGRDHGVDPVRLVEDVWLFDEADVHVEAERIWAAGGEGIMLKDAAAPYVRSRSDSWLKVKRPGIE
jgi:ATP-dependent DNA ligase